MSQYGTIFRMQWLMMESDVEVTLNIYDTEHIIADDEDPTIITMKSSGTPLVVSTVNNDRVKWGIRAKQATIQFQSSNIVNGYTFADAKDYRWYVEAKTDEPETIFLGYLVLDEIQRPFLPNPNIVELRASDGLGLLKERPLVTDADETPTGKNRIADYLSWCLVKTGLSLPIKVANNIKPGTGVTTIDFANFSNASSTIFFPTSTYPQFYEGQRLLVASSGSNNGTTFTVVTNNGGLNIQVTPAPVHESGITNFTLTDTETGHIYDVCHLDAKTFEAEIGECEGSYTVLEKILDKDCFLTQYRGAWWIMRPDDFDDNSVYIQNFDADGTLGSADSAATYNHDIGYGETIHWVEASAAVEYGRPHKFSKHTFTYEYPKELPCNIDFARGAYESDVSATEKVYALDCWTLKEGVPGFSGTVDGTTAKIHRIFNGNSYEIERYVVLTPRTSFETNDINDRTYIESEGIPIEVMDKFSASVRWRNNVGIATGGGDYKILTCVLNGNDGSRWILGEETIGDGVPRWYNTNLWTTFSSKGKVTINFDTIDEETWQNVSWESAAAPVTGTLYFWLNQFNQNSASDDNKEIWYNDFSFTYIPFINSSYQGYSGQSSKVERTDEGYSANLDEDVSISDSPKPILKGGIFFERSGVYSLVPTFWNSTPFALGAPPDGNYFHPYEYIRVFATYNQNRRGIRYFSGQIKWSGNDWPDLIHKYYLTDADYDSNNRRFMALSIEQNWKTGIATISLAETYNTDGRTYDDPFEFKYISQ